MSVIVEGTEIVRRESSSGSSQDAAPSYAIVPLMYAHLAITGDLSQHKQWRDRLEKFEQSNEIEAASNPHRRSLLRNNDAWKKIRMASWLGANWTALVGSVGTAWLMYE